MFVHGWLPYQYREKMFIDKGPVKMKKIQKPYKQFYYNVKLNKVIKIILKERISR